MEEKKLTEKESLELITTMIARTRERYVGDGNILLMWGYLIITVTVLTWVLLAVTGNRWFNMLWFLIGLIGSILTPIMARRQHKDAGVVTYSDRVSQRIWIYVGRSAIAFTVFCLAFMFFGGISAWSVWFMFALVIVPFAEIAQGIVIKEQSMVAGGAVGLTIGIFTMCCVTAHVVMQAVWYMPLFILANICMMIVPGHIINYKARESRERA